MKASPKAPKKGAKPLAKVSVGQKVWLLNPHDPNMKVAVGIVSAVVGEVTHFHQIDKGWCKVDVTEALAPDASLMRPNEMDDQVVIRDVVKTSTVWEVKHIKVGA